MGKRIVIIEDDKDILEILILIFTDAGYVATGYETGKTAVEIELLAPDIVLLDVNIAGYPKNGAEICSELKLYAPTRRIPVMLLSAEKNLALFAGSCSADGFMSKPFDIDELLKRVAELLHGPL